MGKWENGKMEIRGGGKMGKYHYLAYLFIYLKETYNTRRCLEHATKKIEFGQYDDDYDEDYDYDNEKCSPEHNLPKEFVSECFNAESFWLHVGSCKCAET